jgi:hypothetical protein
LSVLAESPFYAQRAENASGKNASGEFEGLAPRCRLCQDPRYIVK